MKILFSTFLLAAICFSCTQKLEQARKDILQLEAHQMAVTDSVNDWVARLDNQMLNWDEMYADMSLLTLEEINLREQGKARIDSLDEALENHGDTYRQLKEEAEFHLMDCLEAAQAISFLKSQLGTDTVNVARAYAKIDLLKSEMESHTSEFSHWEEALNLTRTACMKTCAEYAKLTSGDGTESLY